MFKIAFAAVAMNYVTPRTGLGLRFVGLSFEVQNISASLYYFLSFALKFF